MTSKAQDSPAYQDYLSRCGEDNALHYDVKIKASRLLLDHVDDTFVTPVFNGSASLRSASGQLVEEVTKAVRRKKEVNAAFIDDLYDDVASLYHLNESSPRLCRQSRSRPAAAYSHRPAVLSRRRMGIDSCLHYPAGNEKIT